MARLARNPEVVATELEDGAVLLNMESRLYYSLNDTGLELWRSLESAERQEDLTKLLLQRYDVDEEPAQRSISRFVEELQQEGLVRPAPDEAAPAAPMGATSAPDVKRPFTEPALVKHDEPLHDVATSPFDPQLPLAE